jgi:hypothetical protein
MEKQLIDEIREDMRKPKKRKKEEVRKIDVPLVTVLITVLLILIIAGVGYCAERYVDWRAEHEWQYPTKWVGFYREIEKTTSNSIANAEGIKTLTEQDIINNSRHPKEINNIWVLESGKGTNENPGALHNYCKSKGETNEFGFGGMQSMMCFKTFQESVDRVSQWLDEQTSEIYCYYSVGTRINDCDYAVKAGKL